MKSSFSISPSRKGFEMAVSTLVVMILGILIVGGGMVLVAKISSGGTEIVKQVSSDRQRELNDLMNDGYLVAVAPSHQKVGAGKEADFGIGIMNVEDDASFSIRIWSESQGIAAAGQRDETKWRVNYLPVIDVGRNERGTARIIVAPGKNVPNGDYTFFVNVTKDDTLYDSTRFFTVRVQ